MLKKIKNDINAVHTVEKNANAYNVHSESESVKLEPVNDDDESLECPGEEAAAAAAAGAFLFIPLFGIIFRADGNSWRRVGRSLSNLIVHRKEKETTSNTITNIAK